MAVGRLKGQNVKPKRVDDSNDDGEVEAFENFDEDMISQSSGDEDGSSRDESQSDDSDSAAADRKLAEHEGENINDQVANVSFAALLRAQDTLSRKRKRGSDTAAEQDAKLDQVRSRLHEIRSEKSRTDEASRSSQVAKGHEHSQSKQRNGNSRHSGEARGSGHGKNRQVESEDESDSDSAPSEEGAPRKSRTSKHAPATQSSKHQVTRKRTVVDVPKRVIRDPRFDALHQSSIHPGNSEKAYSFLRDYQKAEIAELKSAVKQAKNEDDKETLRRKLVSMENRLKSKEAVEREQEVLRRHRKEEREKVEQGKKMFFLKRKDVKERALAERFQNMKKKDQQKLIDRRKKKESQKEMKRMPEARRVNG